ncbi:MAG: NADP-dependent oxidoreductase [Thermoplasmata archaeon]|jgi:NADPH-dependent curcumin reductase
MSAGMNRQWLIASRPDGLVGEHNFRWVQSPIPTPGAGQAVVRNLWLSLDPTQLLFMQSEGTGTANSIGGVLSANAVAQVADSRLPDFSRGDIVQGFFGWEDYTLTDGTGFLPMSKVPDGIPPNLALGIYGLTGMAAYFGVIDIGRPQKGETFVVSGAAGGVGSVAGQIARIQGLRVIGIAGGKEKCDWLVRECGFDGAIDHRSDDVGDRLSALCPDGIDIYFDNVGGTVLDVVLERLRQGGRIVLCGGTSRYGAKVEPPGPINYLALVMCNGRMQGLLARDYVGRFPEARAAMASWIRSGQLAPKEDVVRGLENAPKAFARLFTGANLGKQLLKIADPSPSG